MSLLMATLSGRATTAEEIAKKFGVSPSTVRQATTDWRKRRKANDK